MQGQVVQNTPKGSEINSSMEKYRLFEDVKTGDVLAFNNNLRYRDDEDLDWYVNTFDSIKVSNNCVISVGGWSNGCKVVLFEINDRQHFDFITSHEITSSGTISEMKIEKITENTFLIAYVDSSIAGINVFTVELTSLNSLVVGQIINICSGKTVKSICLDVMDLTNFVVYAINTSDSNTLKSFHGTISNENIIIPGAYYTRGSSSTVKIVKCKMGSNKTLILAQVSSRVDSFVSVWNGGTNFSFYIATTSIATSITDFAVAYANDRYVIFGYLTSSALYTARLSVGTFDVTKTAFTNVSISADTLSACSYDNNSAIFIGTKNSGEGFICISRYNEDPVENVTTQNISKFNFTLAKPIAIKLSEKSIIAITGKIRVYDIINDSLSLRTFVNKVITANTAKKIATVRNATTITNFFVGDALHISENKIVLAYVDQSTNKGIVQLVTTTDNGIEIGPQVIAMSSECTSIRACYMYDNVFIVVYASSLSARKLYARVATVTATISLGTAVTLPDMWDSFNIIPTSPTSAALVLVDTITPKYRLYQLTSPYNNTTLTLNTASSTDVTYSRNGYYFSGMSIDYNNILFVTRDQYVKHYTLSTGSFVSTGNIDLSLYPDKTIPVYSNVKRLNSSIAIISYYIEAASETKAIKAILYDYINKQVVSQPFIISTTTILDMISTILPISKNLVLCAYVDIDKYVVIKLLNVINNSIYELDSMKIEKTIFQGADEIVIQPSGGKYNIYQVPSGIGSKVSVASIEIGSNNKLEFYSNKVTIAGIAKQSGSQYQIIDAYSF